MYSLNSAAQEIVSYWETERVIPFKGQLINKDDNGNICMCAQGQALHIVGGYTEEQLFAMTMTTADKETARILDISVTHSVFLRIINDSCEESPQDVLNNPAKYLGPNFKKVLELWKNLDTLNYQEKKKIYDLYWALDFNVRDSAIDAAWNAAGEVVGWKFSEAAWRAVQMRVFGFATHELIGIHKLRTQTTFIPLILGE